MLRLRHLSVALLAALAVSAAAHAGTTDFNKMVVFGDSLSDNGNLSLAGGATQASRFTTNPGKVTVEVIAGHYGFSLTPSITGGTDFAFGGAGILNNSPGTPAGVPTITAQITNYLAATHGMDGHTLYTMWGGANDIFYAATSVGAGAMAEQLIQQNVAAQIAKLQQANVPAAQIQAMTPTITQQVTTAVTQQVLAGAHVSSFMTPDQAQAATGAAAGQELKLLGQMHAAGANYVVVFNLPDIGKTPSGTGQGAAAAQGLTGLTLLYNGVLDSGLNTLSDHGLNVIPVNVYGLFNEVIANPAAFGFSNVTTPACGVGSTSVECGPQGSGAKYTYAPGTENSYLFADGVHPTTAAHEMLGDYVIAELNAPGQVSMLAEAPLAAANAHLGILRNQMRVDQAGGSTRAFVGLSYARQRFDATGNSPKTNSNNADLTIGVDAAAGSHFNAGVALGLAHTNADIAGGGFRLDSVIGSGYALWHRGGGYLGANIGFAQLSYNNINRRFQIGALTRNETGQTGGSQLMGGLSGGWWFGSSTIRTGPFARIQWQHVRVNGYSEAGNDSSAMWFNHQLRNALVGTLGWQLKGNWHVASSVLHPYLNVAWNHDSRAKARKVRAGLTGMQGSFALTGFIPDTSWASVDLGLTDDFSDSVSGWVAYHGRFADSNERVNSLNLGIKIGF